MRGSPPSAQRSQWRVTAPSDSLRRDDLWSHSDTPGLFNALAFLFLSFSFQSVFSFPGPRCSLSLALFPSLLSRLPLPPTLFCAHLALRACDGHHCQPIQYGPSLHQQVSLFRTVVRVHELLIVRSPFREEYLVVVRYRQGEPDVPLAFPPPPESPRVFLL